MMEELTPLEAALARLPEPGAPAGFRGAVMARVAAADAPPRAAPPAHAAAPRAARSRLPMVLGAAALAAYAGGFRLGFWEFSPPDGSGLDWLGSFPPSLGAAAGLAVVLFVYIAALFTLAEVSMRRVSATVAVALLTAAAAARPAAAVQIDLPTLATESAQPPAQVMVLGVFHFHNPNADYAKFQGIDVLTPARQAEIDTVVGRLAAFSPTRVALERLTREADTLNARYRRFRSGNFELTRNEIHQLGYRVAARGGHPAVYPVDYPKGMRIDSLLAYAGDREPAFRSAFERYIGGIVTLLDSLQRDATIRENLLFLNDPANVVRTHEPYAVQATVGANDGYIGARVVAEWYERNLAIFANLARVAQRGERVLFIVGAGHVPILRELVRAHPDMVLVEPNAYLQ